MTDRKTFLRPHTETISLSISFMWVQCTLGCPRLWRITKNSLHNEGTYKWVNWEPIFFDTNYFQLLLGLRSLQKSAFLKLTILLFQYFWCQNWDQWHKLSGKNTHIFFFYFWFKNKRVWAEKIGKKRKNSKNLKVAGNYPNI